jgi:hypothetical protein
MLTGVKRSLCTFIVGRRWPPDDEGGWLADAIEAKRSHVSEDQASKAYHRARYWEERIQMAEW